MTPRATPPCTIGALVRRTILCGWALGILILTSSTEGAAPTTGSVALSEPKTNTPLNGLLEQLGADQKSRVAPIVGAASTNERVNQSAVLETLLALNPELVHALAFLNDGHPADAIPILDRLAGAPDPFLAKHAAWFKVRALIGLERYEEALASLASTQAAAERYTQLADEMLYTEGLLQAYLFDRPAAASTFRRYLEQYPQAPAAERRSAKTILAALEQIDTNSLPEATRLMNESRRRLNLDDSGDITQTRQRQIVFILDKLIEEAEKNQNGGGSGAGGGSGSGRNRGGASGGQGAGAKESTLNGGTTGVKLVRPAEGDSADDWAKAYNRDRETVQRELQNRLPERYRELIEQYYRSLSAGDKTDTEPRK